jgi:hypothetical protein
MDRIMSKRLRASMRAANKGRNLRPRATQSHLDAEPAQAELGGVEPHEAEAPAEEALPEAPLEAPPEAPLAQVVASEPEAPARARVAEVVIPKPPPVPDREPPTTSPSPDLRTRETLRDPAVRVEAGLASSDAAIPAPSKPRIPMGGDPQAMPAKPVATETAKTAPQDNATTLSSPSPIPKAAPVKAEEPKKAAPTPAAKVDEPKKPAPAKAEEPKKATPKATQALREAPAAKKAEHAPISHKPASSHPAEEDLDPSSISAAFFRRDQDSVPPVEEHEEELAPPQIVLSPTTLARRARLRRAVAGVVAFLCVVSIAVVSKSLATKRQPPMPVAVETRRELPAVGETKPVADQKVAAADVKAPDKVEDKKQGDPAAKDEPKPEEAKKDDAKKDEARPEEAKKDEPKKDEPKKDEAKPEEAKKDDAKKDEPKKDEATPAAAAPSAADAAALRKETLSLLNRGKNKDAIEKAKEAIVADPSDATAYLYLGSALQDSGKFKDGLEAYCECVRNATKGPINECRAMGGHK